jgi:hypothetical protein
MGAAPRLNIDHLKGKMKMVLRSPSSGFTFFRKRVKEAVIKLRAWMIFAGIIVAIVILAVTVSRPPDPNGMGLSP